MPDGLEYIRCKGVRISLEELLVGSQFQGHNESGEQIQSIL